MDAQRYVIVRPWLDIEEDVSIGEFTLRSSERAAATLVDRDVLRAVMGHYFENARFKDAPDRGSESTLRPVTPAIIVLDRKAEFDAAYDAILALFFAVIIDNTTSRYANGATFRVVHHNLPSTAPAFQIETRQMFGRRVDYTESRYMISVRPRGCGRYHAPNQAALSLVLDALRSPLHEQFRRALRLLLQATSDSQEEFAVETERLFMAMTLETALHRNGQHSGNRREQQDILAHDLVAKAVRTMRRASVPGQPLCTWPSDEFSTERMLRELRLERNQYVHPRPGRNLLLEDQEAVAPNLMYFRALSAVLLSAMADAIDRELPPRLAAYCAAVEDWCDVLPSMLSAEADEVVQRYGELYGRYLVAIS